MSWLFYQILLVKEFIIETGIAGCVLMTGFLLLAVRGKRGFRHYGIQAFFFHRNVGEMLFLSCAILQLMMVLSCVLCGVTLERIHLLILAVLCVIRFLSVPELGILTGDILHTGLLITAMLAGNMLNGYLRQSSHDIWFSLMYWFLNIFIIEYAVYYFMRSIQLLAGEQGRVHRAQDRLLRILSRPSRNKVRKHARSGE